MEILQKTNRRMMAIIRHMRRSAFFRRQVGRPDNGNYLESRGVNSHNLPSVRTCIIQKRQHLLMINNN